MDVPIFMAQKNTKIVTKCHIFIRYMLIQCLKKYMYYLLIYPDTFKMLWLHVKYSLNIKNVSSCISACAHNTCMNYVQGLLCTLHVPS